MSDVLRAAEALLERNRPETPAAAPEPSLGDSFSQGLRSGGLAAYGQLNTLAGGLADQFSPGSDFARDRLAQGQDLRRQAAEAAPSINSWDQVHSLRDFAHYAAGLGGQMIPASAVGIGAGLLTRNPGSALAAGTAAMTPFEAGDILQRQQEAGQPLDPRQALLYGAGSSALMNVVPAAARARFAGVKVPGSALAAIPEQAALAGGSEAVKQKGANQELDLHAVRDAAIGGGVVGVPLAGMHAAGKLVGAGVRAGTSVKDLAGKAGDAAGAAASAAKDAAGGAKDAAVAAVPDIAKSIKEWGAGVKERGEKLMERFSKGESSGDPALDAEIIAAQQAGDQGRLAELGGKIDAAREKFTTALKDKLLGDPDMPPSRKQELMRSLAEQSGEAKDAAVVAAHDTWEKAKAATKQAADFAKSALDRVRGKEPAETKKSEDFSGVERVFTDIAAPILKERMPEVFDDPKALADIGRGLRGAHDQLVDKGRVNEATHEHLSKLFGDETHTVLQQMLEATVDGRDKAGEQRAYQGIQDFIEQRKRNTDAYDTLRKNLPHPEKTGADYTEGDLRDLHKVLQDYVAGKHLSDGEVPAKRQLREQQARAELEKVFGDKTDKVLDAYRQEAEGNKPETGVDFEDTGPEGTLNGERAPDIEAVSSKPVPSPELHRSVYDSESAAERQIKQAQGDGARARWVPAKEYAALTGHDVGDVPEGHGFVIKESLKDGDALSAREVSALRYDKQKGARDGNDPSVIKTPDGVFDAKKITRAMDRSEPYDVGDDKSRPHRLARMFIAGVAKLQEHLGKPFEIPDSTVIAEGLTYGDAKKLGFAPKPKEGARDYTAELNGLRKEYAEAKKAGASTKDIEKRAQAVMDARDGHIVGDQGKRRPVDDVLDELGKQDIDPHNENVHVAEAKLGDDGMAVHTDPSGAPLTYDKSRSPEGFRGFVDSMAKRLQAGKSAAARALGEKAQTLVDHFDQLSEVQKGALWAAMKEIKDQGKLSAGAETINGLYTKLSDKLTKQPAKEVPAQGPKDRLTQRARSGDPELLKEVAKHTDAAQLARAAEHLASLKDPKVQPALDAINERIGKLVSEHPDVAYSMQTANRRGNITPAEKTAVLDYVHKVLGPTIQVAFKAMTHAGEYTRDHGVDVIRVAVSALDPLSTAHHEALHAFFARLRDSGAHDVTRVLEAAASSPRVMKQMREAFKDQPEVMRQILGDREERAAYMYQLWAAKKLKVGDEATGVLGRVREFIRKVTGLWSNDHRALRIMEEFEKGEFARDPKAFQRAVMEQGRIKALDKLADMAKPMAHLAQEIAEAGHQRLRDTGVPSLIALADQLKAHHTDAGEGFLQAARVQRATRMNALSDKLSQYSKDQLNDAMALLRGTKTRAQTGPEAALAAREVRKHLDEMYDYMTAAGVKVNDLGYGKDYFPRVYDPDYLSRHQKEFVTLLESHGFSTEYATGVLNKLINADGSELQIETTQPGMTHLKTRTLVKIPDAELAPFMKQNLHDVLNSYTSQATRRAEWAKRFGDDGGKLLDLLAQAKKEGATPEQLADADRYVRAVDGTLGDNISPTLRRFYGNMIVYQNLRLLPLAIFSSVVDPHGVLVRGGTVGDAWNTFRRGVREIAGNFKHQDKDEMRQLAETMGVIDNATLIHHVGALYSQGMVGNTARKVNDTFFRFNLMERFNESMRVGATEAALKFIARHADGTASEHSKRWMDELGLSKDDVQFDPALGRIKLKQSEGLTADREARLRTAVNRWVDGAVLRPDAADKPMWMNDPHYALVSHLKQFVFSFHETILKRVMHEHQYGNNRPLMALAAYVPTMIAADMVKGLIQGGGQEPEWKRKWGAGDYVWSGVQRAGLFGVGQFAVDAGTYGLGSLGGPTIEQLAEATSVMDGNERFGHFLLKSMPANALYAHAAGVAPEDPKFAD